MARTFAGHRLREIRRSRGIRTEYVAVVIKRCSRTVEGYERGSTNPPASIVAALADLLDIDVSELFTDTEPTDTVVRDRVAVPGHLAVSA